MLGQRRKASRQASKQASKRLEPTSIQTQQKWTQQTVPTGMGPCLLIGQILRTFGTCREASARVNHGSHVGGKATSRLDARAIWRRP